MNFTRDEQVENLRIAASYLETYEGPFNMDTVLVRDKFLGIKVRRKDYDKPPVTTVYNTDGCALGKCAVSGIKRLRAVKGETWDGYMERVFGELWYNTARFHGHPRMLLSLYCFSAEWAYTEGQETAKAAAERFRTVAKYLEYLTQD